MKKNFQFSIFNFQKGFTSIEILIAVVILAIAITITTLSFGKLNDNQVLDKAALTAISALDEARALTLSSLNSQQYSIVISESGLSLNSRTGVRNVNLAGGVTTVYFKKLTGATVQTGTFEIYLKSSTTMYRKINIAATGLAEEI